MGRGEYNEMDELQVHIYDSDAISLGKVNRRTGAVVI